MFQVGDKVKLHLEGEPYLDLNNRIGTIERCSHVTVGVRLGEDLWSVAYDQIRALNGVQMMIEVL
jgi:hypothetical protein